MRTNLPRGTVPLGADGSEVVVLLDAGFRVVSTKGGKKSAR